MKRPGTANCFGLLSSLLLVLCVGACIPEPLEVKNIPAVQPEIVVASQLLPDSSVAVLLTKTIGALEASDDSDPLSLISQIAVTDAQVRISGPSGTYPLLPIGMGLYGGIFIPLRAGETYRLEVDSESLGQVTATTTVQERVRFEEIRAGLYYNSFNDTLAEINYTLADPPVKNWYLINVQEVKLSDITQNLINPRDFNLLVDDQNFNGQTVSAMFRVFPRDYAPGDTIAVSLAHISTEYHQFMKIRMDNRFSYLEFLSEPINYPSNVEGGKGFFNLYIPDIHFFVLE